MERLFFKNMEFWRKWKNSLGVLVVFGLINWYFYCFNEIICNNLVQQIWRIRRNQLFASEIWFCWWKLCVVAEKLALEAKIHRWRDRYPDDPGGRVSEKPRGPGPSICIDEINAKLVGFTFRAPKGVLKTSLGWVVSNLSFDDLHRNLQEMTLAAFIYLYICICIYIYI